MDHWGSNLGTFPGTDLPQTGPEGGTANDDKIRLGGVCRGVHGLPHALHACRQGRPSLVRTRCCPLRTLCHWYLIPLFLFPLVLSLTLTQVPLLAQH